MIHRIHGCGNHQRMEDGSSHHWCDDENMVDGARTTRTDWKDRATDVAQRWSWADGTGTIGFIESISNPFCGACSRMRVTADGHLHTCLFSAHGTDLRPTLRGEGTSNPRSWTSGAHERTGTPRSEGRNPLPPSALRCPSSEDDQVSIAGKVTDAMTSCEVEGPRSWTTMNRQFPSSVPSVVLSMTK